MYLFSTHSHPWGLAVALSEVAHPPRYRPSYLPGRRDAFSASVSCWWVTPAGTQPARPQLRKWVRELQQSKTSQRGLGMAQGSVGKSLHQEPWTEVWCQLLRMTLGKFLSQHQLHSFGVCAPCSYCHETLTTAIGVWQSTAYHSILWGNCGSGGLSQGPALHHTAGKRPV